MLSLAVIILSVSCVSRSGLFVSGGNAPVFEIRRSSSAHVKIFPIFIVKELHPDNENRSPLHQNDEKNLVLWKIVADSTVGPAASTEELQRIEYGKVPFGFIQEVPSQGPPKELRENQTYEGVGPLSLMSNAVVRFKIINGKVVNVAVP